MRYSGLPAESYAYAGPLTACFRHQGYLLEIFRFRFDAARRGTRWKVSDYSKCPALASAHGGCTRMNLRTTALGHILNKGIMQCSIYFDTCFYDVKQADRKDARWSLDQ